MSSQLVGSSTHHLIYGPQQIPLPRFLCFQQLHILYYLKIRDMILSYFLVFSYISKVVISSPLVIPTFVNWVSTLGTISVLPWPLTLLISNLYKHLPS